MTDTNEIRRVVPLLDYEIDRSGDGRTVIAYAATWDPYPVMDAEGDYDELINPTAFNRTIGRGIANVAVHYNHGMTLWGTPSDRYAAPVGVPVEIKPDARGLLTTTRYANTDLGEEMLQLWRDGAIKAQSFRGTVYRSAAPRRGENGRIVRERLEMGLREYGPTPNPANAAAGLVAVRSQLLTEVSALSPEERRELATLLADSSAPDPREAPTSTPADEPPVEMPAAVDPSVFHQLHASIAARRRR